MNRFEDVAQSFIRLSDADITEVYIVKRDYLVNRYANSFITQNTSVNDITVGIRLRYGKKVGIAYTDDLSSESFRETFKRAKESALNSKEDDELSEPPSRVDMENINYSYSDELEEPQPERIQRILTKVIKSSKNFLAFGNMVQGSIEEFFANSKGFRYYNRKTFASINVNYMDETYKRSGWYQFASYKFSDLENNIDKVIEKAFRKVELNKDPIELKPGKYTVIVEPIALEEIVLMLSWLGFSGKSYIEGRSFLSGKLNEKVFSEKLTIYDNPEELRLFSMHMDFEGTLKRKLPLIENGVLKNIALNKYIARKLNRESTGHAIFPFSKDTFPLHIEVMGGEKSLDDIISETEYGILVSRFWYVNPVDLKTFTLTGMTRDGTFLIEKGKLTRAVKNMRFTQSFMEAFNNISAISSERELISQSNFYSFYPSGSLLPAVRLEDFYFSSVSEF